MLRSDIRMLPSDHDRTFKLTQKFREEYKRKEKKDLKEAKKIFRSVTEGELQSDDSHLDSAGRRFADEISREITNTSEIDDSSEYNTNIEAAGDSEAEAEVADIADNDTATTGAETYDAAQLKLEDLPEIIGPEEYKILKLLRTHRKEERIAEQKLYSKFVKESNSRIVDNLLSNFDDIIDNDGFDIYTYFNYHSRLKLKDAADIERNESKIYGQYKKRRNRKRGCCFRFPNTFHKYYSSAIVILIQLMIPFILLIRQIIENNSFVPLTNNFWFRITGFLVMSYSTTILRKQIVDQVNWFIIDNNKIIHRIDKKITLPKTGCLYIGLYINLIMSLVVTTNIYLMYCASESLIELILNTAALTFLISIDNDAFKLLINNPDVKNIIHKEAESQMATLLERANFYEIRIVRKMTLSLEYIIFYVVALYSMIMPLVFIFYGVEKITFGKPCLGIGNETCVSD